MHCNTRGFTPLLLMQDTSWHSWKNIASDTNHETHERAVLIFIQWEVQWLLPSLCEGGVVSSLSWKHSAPRKTEASSLCTACLSDATWRQVCDRRWVLLCPALAPSCLSCWVQTLGVVLATAGCFPSFPLDMRNAGGPVNCRSTGAESVHVTQRHFVMCSIT